MTLPDKECVGCGACAASCPMGCIEMAEDAAGFLRPEVQDERCSGCGRCEAVCPSLNPSTHDGLEGAYWARDTSAAALKAASSGGVFGLLASTTVDAGGAVYGAVFGDDWTVGHERTCSLQGVAALKKSKYAQSRVSPDVYRAARKDLLDGRPVLFSGTACQIAGLKAFLGKMSGSELLTCAEVICHGAPSPRLWAQYVAFLESSHQSKLVSFSFREKEPSWSSYSVRAVFENGDKWQVPYLDCWFMAAFMHDLPLRDSCYSCPFKRRSGSDLVLGDFWGVGKVLPSLDARDGVSAIVANTAKGKSLLVGLSGCELGEVDYRDVLAGNRSLEIPTPMPEGRASFVEGIALDDISELMRAWTFKKSKRQVWSGRARKALRAAGEIGPVGCFRLGIYMLSLLFRGAGKSCIKEGLKERTAELKSTR